MHLRFSARNPHNCSKRDTMQAGQLPSAQHQTPNKLSLGSNIITVTCRR
jgi:hypothetical protein